MDVCLDTSAINALCDDANKGPLALRIKSKYRVLLTAVNVIEVVATPNQQRRRDLLSTMQLLSDGTALLAAPTNLIKRVTRAFARRKRNVTITTPSEDAAMWSFINDPDSAGDSQQQEAIQMMRATEEPFRDAHRQARQELQQLMENDPKQRPRSVADLLRRYKKESPQGMYELVRTFYKSATHRHLTPDIMWRMLEAIPHWPLYLAGWAHEMFMRAIRESKYGPKGKPGSMDLWMAIYLPHCDVFVTNDKGQYRALSVLNVLSKRMPAGGKTRVVRYNHFVRNL